MIRELNIEEALDLNLEDVIFIDVRSPAEYQEDTIPGAINLPLLNNEERKIVGTIYKNEGPTYAKHKALQLVAPRLPQIVESFRKFTDKNIVIFCWRGGHRSKNLCKILQMVDIPAIRIKGGYKAYRKYVYNFLYKNNEIFTNIFVLDGLTGVGKTEIIKNLPRFGVETINLERLANNRGSVFGNLGLNGQPTQKVFESNIFFKLYRLTRNTPLVVEGESKRIGRLFIPELLWKSMNKAKRILVYDTLENRVFRSMKEYVLNQNIPTDQYVNAVKRLKDRLGKKMVDKLVQKIYEREFEEVTAILLENYYDKIYKIPEDSKYSFKVSSANIMKACEEIKACIHSVSTKE